MNFEVKINIPSKTNGKKRYSHRLLRQTRPSLYLRLVAHWQDTWFHSSSTDYKYKSQLTCTTEENNKKISIKQWVRKQNGLKIRIKINKENRFEIWKFWVLKKTKYFGIFSLQLLRILTELPPDRNNPRIKKLKIEKLVPALRRMLSF